MTYTICEVCGNKQYCFLQFRPEVQEEEYIIINRAVCPQCLTFVYHINRNRKQIKIHSHYS